MAKFAKCIICDKKAFGRLSPDIDIVGLGFCKKHKDIVSTIYLLINDMSVSEVESMIKSERKKYKNEIKNRKDL